MSKSVMTTNLPDTSKFKVLLVDDSLDNQLLIQSLLEKEGLIVELASDGAEGLKKVENGHYDLVIMDIEMPIMDGYVATSTLRKHGYKKSIIAFTAHTSAQERERCIKAGFTDFINKPIKKSELLGCIAKYRTNNIVD